MSGTWHSRGLLSEASRSMIRIRINLKPDGVFWRVGVIEIRSPQQHQSVQLDHLPPASFHETVELAKQHARGIVGLDEQVEWEISPKTAGP
jgi:hypothetical protein